MLKNFYDKSVVLEKEKEELMQTKEREEKEQFEINSLNSKIEELKQSLEKAYLKMQSL